MLNVLIFGCGPAGLMAAHAAARYGCNVRILSKPRKSFMKGAQYLHAPIPGASGAPFRISYNLWGTTDGYRDKVYGIDSSGVEVSPDTLSSSHAAWDIREAYDWLWDTYGSYVVPWEANHSNARRVMDELKPDMTISTVPATLLCDGEHAFSYTTIYSTDQLMNSSQTDDTVVCNGLPETGWYRSSLIQGWANTEWPADRKPPLPQSRLWEVTKPIKNTCTCLPGVYRYGRYGKWTKGALSHEAFYEVDEILKETIGAPSRT